MGGLGPPGGGRPRPLHVVHDPHDGGVHGHMGSGGHPGPAAGYHQHLVAGPGPGLIGAHQGRTLVPLRSHQQESLPGEALELFGAPHITNDGP